MLRERNEKDAEWSPPWSDFAHKARPARGRGIERRPGIGFGFRSPAEASPFVVLQTRPLLFCASGAPVPMDVLLWIAAAFLLVGGGLYGLYGAYLHPAWRKERRIRRACEKAFGEGGYRLVRLRLHVEEPSGADLFPTGLLGGSELPRYFTYRIEAEQDPEFAGMGQKEIGLVRHYLDRTLSAPHHGREVLGPESGSPQPRRDRSG